MINDIIKQILILDQKTEQARQKTQQKADEILTQTQSQIKSESDHVLMDTKEAGKTDYEEAIELAEEQSEMYKHKAKTLRDDTLTKFDAIREELAAKTLEMLFLLKE